MVRALGDLRRVKDFILTATSCGAKRSNFNNLNGGFAESFILPIISKIIAQITSDC